MINAVSEFDSMIETVRENLCIPGIPIGLIANGEIALCRGYGHRNITEDWPMTTDTIVGIGSSSKAFATYLLGQLVEEGKISWDDPIIHHVPEFRLADSGATQTITIRDLVLFNKNFWNNFCVKVAKNRRSESGLV